MYYYPATQPAQILIIEIVQGVGPDIFRIGIDLDVTEGPHFAFSYVLPGAVAYHGHIPHFEAGIIDLTDLLTINSQFPGRAESLDGNYILSKGFCSHYSKIQQDQWKDMSEDFFQSITALPPPSLRV